MKLKNLIITPNGDEFVAVNADGVFNGMIRMNHTAAFIAEELKEDKTLEQLVARVCEKYDVTADIAEQNVNTFIRQFKSINMIEE